MDITKYDGILHEINAEIEQFNSLLTNFRFPLLDATKPDSCFILANVPWDTPQIWPCSDRPGVYVLCAYQQGDPKRVAAYVGKASWNNIGDRIWSHLSRQPQHAQGIYTMNDLSGQTFIIEAIVAIGVLEARMRCLALALEEFIIDGVQTRVHLLNGTGVER